MVKLNQRNGVMFMIAKRGRAKGWTTEQTLQDLKDANQLLPSRLTMKEMNEVCDEVYSEPDAGRV